MNIDMITNETARLMMDRLTEKEEKRRCPHALPSREGIDRLMQLIRQLIFPSIFMPPQEKGNAYSYQQLMQTMADKAREQIEAGLRSVITDTPCDSTVADEMTAQFVQKLPEIQQLLYTDVEAVGHNDPAATSEVEIIGCYPAITVMLFYRVAHALYEIGVPLVPRMMTERAHSITGVDIHPAAKIGASFGIDHGTGIVIGETAIIGNEVMLYQGVTLGAKNFHRSEEGTLLNLPRHPIIEDRVTIYSNSTILGRIRIGHDSVIGGNLWITKDIAPNSRVRQSKPVKFHGFIDGAGI